MKITIKEYIDKYPERLLKGGTIDVHFSKEEYCYDDIVLDCFDCPDDIEKLYFNDELAHGIDKCHEIININNKEIDLFASNFNRLVGSNNKISISHIHSPYLKVFGYNNKIYHCSNSNLDVVGSRNKIEFSDVLIGEFMGNDNIILCWNSGRIYIPRDSKDNTIVMGGYSQCSNGDPSTKICCFNSSICRTIEGTDNIKTYENSKVITYKPYLDPREECEEPIDEEYGYFYKVVEDDLRSILYDGTYSVGEWMFPDSFSENDKVCAHGIHFFATKEQAVFFSETGMTNYKILKLKVRFDDIAITNNYANDTHKMRARKVFVESIVPEGEYAELGGLLTSANI